MLSICYRQAPLFGRPDKLNSWKLVSFFKLVKRRPDNVTGSLFYFESDTKIFITRPFWLDNEMTKLRYRAKMAGRITGPYYTYVSLWNQQTNVKRV